MIRGAGVLAGAYKGKDIGERTLLIHAVSDVPIQAGRLKRDYGDAFCNAKLDLVDEGAWYERGKITCPRCLEILARTDAP